MSLLADGLVVRSRPAPDDTADDSGHREWIVSGSLTRTVRHAVSAGAASRMVFFAGARSTSGNTGFGGGDRLV